MSLRSSVGETSQPDRSLSVTDLHVSYVGGVDVLHGVTLEVAPGEVVCLLGRNGAGKTTLIKALCGLLPLRSGRIEYRGADLTGADPRRIVVSGIAVVPEGRRVFANLTVAENLAMGAYSRRSGAGPSWRFERAYDVFPRLAERRNQLAGTLSGGEQQMVAMGRALMAEPALLLLDEPSMGLAPMLIELIFDTINRLAMEGMTILLVEQNAAAALDVADRAYVLERGRIETSGPAPLIENDPQIRQSYLGA
jgi:branched-chain amino acid transport system ATP-binding protein